MATTKVQTQAGPRRSVISGDTLIPLGAFAAIAAAIFWIGYSFRSIESNAKAIVKGEDRNAKFEERVLKQLEDSSQMLQSIDRRVSRIEGALGVDPLPLMSTRGESSGETYRR